MILATYGFSEDEKRLPATTLYIKENSEFNPPDGKRVFFRGDYGFSMLSLSSYAVGAGVGYKTHLFFYDLTSMYYNLRYEAVRVHQKDVTPTTPFNQNTEVGRTRLGNERQSIFTVGPGMGVMFQLFHKPKWVEIARFGINYMSMNDTFNDISFRGGLANFQVATGYLFDSILLSGGVTWNVGYVHRINSSQLRADPIEHNNFLPLNWWSAQFGATFWVR